MTIQEIRQKAVNYYEEVNPEHKSDPPLVLDLMAKFAFKELGLQFAEDQAWEIIFWIREIPESLENFKLTMADRMEDVADWDGQSNMFIDTRGFNISSFKHFCSVLHSYGMKITCPELSEKMIVVYSVKKDGAKE